MEDYLEELRTPPVALVCLVEFPELHHPISAFLHSEQPPINILALLDFSKASVLARKKSKDPLSHPTPAPLSGILKRDWLLKHCTRVPAVVVALFHANQISGDAQWFQACTNLARELEISGSFKEYAISCCSSAYTGNCTYLYLIAYDTFSFVGTGSLFFVDALLTGTLLVICGGLPHVRLELVPCQRVFDT
ncbi:trafficking protein particle complex subunit 11 [Carex littledalei]|uniref:Trafficking protein particle complex subunit 11 n=1 Tax=Carex littledalei TaxID=544730 RepID=A0A833VBD0_9POAL|nr:trafficking protein particle complex subunit 11 [Carex littledalei]